MLRVAVLGSNAFTATDFIDLLLTNEKIEVLGISRSVENSAQSPTMAHRDDRFTFRRLDFNREIPAVLAALDAFAPDTIVNFAAQGDEAASWNHPADFFETNCVALARLVDGLSQNAALGRFLQISSSSVYGSRTKTITEDSPLAPESPYGASKAAADLLLLAYHSNSGFPVQILRPPNLYGRYQPLFRIIPKAIVALKRGEQVELHGGGMAVRAYLHARDASHAMAAVLERGRIGEVYNISPDQPCRIRDIVATVCEILGSDFEASTRWVDDRRSQPSVSTFESSKIRRELGWRPRIALREGLAGMRDWIESDWTWLSAREAMYRHAI